MHSQIRKQTKMSPFVRAHIPFRKRPPVVVTVVCAFCEIIVEIGLLPIKYRSFCGENLSYPCIPFYSN